MKKKQSNKETKKQQQQQKKKNEGQHPKKTFFHQSLLPPRLQGLMGHVHKSLLKIWMNVMLFQRNLSLFSFKFLNGSKNTLTIIDLTMDNVPRHIFCPNENIFLAPCNPFTE